MRTNMNKVLLSLLMLQLILHASAIYAITVDRSGTTSATLTIDSGGVVSIDLPQDANNFRIIGGSYKIINNTAIVDAGESGFTTFSFTSNALTVKQADWGLAVSPPEGSITMIYLPPYAAMRKASAQPNTITSEGSSIVLNMNYSKTIEIHYMLEEIPQTQNDPGGTYIIAIAAAFLIIIGILTLRMKNQAGKPGNHPQGSREETGKIPSLAVSNGKKEMMETFNGNDLRIVNFLLGNQGKARRNELERKTELSKSSLAMALNRLEKRKIIEMDRTATTHHIKLSEYFLKL